MPDSRELAQGQTQLRTSTAAKRRWSVEELNRLDDLLKAGKTAPEIATALQRTRISIYSQLQRLDVKRKRRNG
jgi:hypothetical protein